MNERETISIDDEKKQSFEDLRTKLGNAENKTAFLIAMTYGWRNGTRAPLKKKTSWVRTSYLSDTDRALMVAVAASADGSDDEASPDMNHVYAVAEEYARGGIVYLKELLDSPLDFQQQLSAQVMEAYHEHASGMTQEQDRDE